MNIQTGKVSPPSDGSTTARSAPLSGTNTNAAPAAAPHRAETPASPTISTTQPQDINATRQIANQINEFLKSSGSEVQFTVDSESNRVVVRIIDGETKEVIRQVPSEEMLAISNSLDRMTGLLIQQKV